MIRFNEGDRVYSFEDGLDSGKGTVMEILSDGTPMVQWDAEDHQEPHPAADLVQLTCRHGLYYSVCPDCCPLHPPRPGDR